MGEWLYLLVGERWSTGIVFRGNRPGRATYLVRAKIIGWRLIFGPDPEYMPTERLIDAPS
jgi:hypothetical protein